MNTRTVTGAFEIKSMDDQTGFFSGYGSVFDVEDSYGDVVTKGAFIKSLAASPARTIKMLWQHNREMPIGVYHEAYEDQYGLFLKGQLLVKEIPKARQAYALLKNGAISGLSIGFMINDGGETRKNGINYLTDINLKEVSLVTFPANDQAHITAVKSIKDIKTVKEYEASLREAGVSRSQAKAFAILASKGLVGQCEADDKNDLILAIKRLNQSLTSSEV